MLTEAKNEAADRLREWITATMKEWAAEHTLLDELDAALAEERRATVERIRAALGPHAMCDWDLAFVTAILDEEATAPHS